MNRSFMDYLMSRDGRGRGRDMNMEDMSRGRGRGRRSRRDNARGDMRRSRDYEMDFDMEDDDDEYDARYDNSPYPRQDYARGGRSRQSNRQSDGGTYYPFNVRGNFSRYDTHHYDPYEEEMMMYDMARGGRGGSRGRNQDSRGYYPMDMAGGEYLSNEDLKYWSKKLLEEVEEKDKAYFKMENIEKKAKEMGIEFKEFTKEEFYVATLMTYTDYAKTIGTANLDIYLKLAKDWLCDEDVAVKYGEKLATYFDYVVEGM